MQPVLIDLFCGRGGWTKAALKRGWRCIGYDIADMNYPGELHIRSLPCPVEELAAHNPTLIVASPPCEDYARRWLPWIKDTKPADHTLLDWSISLIGRTPARVIVECSRFAGFEREAKHLAGSYAMWGDLPALMPRPKPRKTNRSGLKPAYRAEIPDDLAGWIIETATPIPR